MTEKKKINYYKRIIGYWIQIENKFISSEAWKEDLITIWRERIILFIYLFAAISGPFALIPSLILSYKEELWAVFVLDITVYGIVVGVLFSRNLSLRLRTWITAVIFYVLGSGLLFIIGFYGAGYIWLFGASLIIGTLVDFKAACVALLMNFLSFILIGLYIYFDSPEWALNIANPLEKWGVMTSNFMMLNTLLTLLVAGMLRSLKSALMREHESAKELKEKQEEIMSIFKANPDPIIVYDDNNDIQYINYAFTKIFGWSLEEFKSPDINFIPENQERITFETYKNLPLTNNQTIIFETKRYRKDGQILNIILSASPIKTNNQDVIGLVINLKDITESRKLENQLQQAQKMESIGTLAGGIAHDFNNILVTIFGYLELAKEDLPEGSPVYSFIENAFDGALRARDLVKQILTFSRYSEHELKPLKAQLIIKEALKLLRASLPATISIKQMINEDCGLIMADPTHIHQIIMNLCTNAFHAMEDKGGILEVKLEEQIISEKKQIANKLETTNFLCISVSDSGTGIPKEIIDRIFEPFYTTKEQGKGTGLGLSVIHGIVKDYGGFIDVKSVLNEGSEFKIYLPIIDAIKQNVFITSDFMIKKGNERILLVDDQKLILNMEKKILEQLGYSVTAVDSSIEAFELFKSNPENFDLIISDMTMPLMTGDVLAKQMYEINKNMSFILCTGYNKQITDDNLSEIGIKGVLYKPFEINKLSRKIREVLDQK